MNRVELIGRATKDPELRYTQGGIAVCSFTLAVDRLFKNKQGEKEADFIPVRVWRKAAENVANYVTKGNMLGVTGRIETGSYENKEGQKVYTTEVVADEVQFLQSKNNSQSNTTPAQSDQKNTSSDPDLIPIPDGGDDEIPF